MTPYDIRRHANNPDAEQGKQSEHLLGMARTAMDLRGAIGDGPLAAYLHYTMPDAMKKATLPPLHEGDFNSEMYAAALQWEHYALWRVIAPLEEFRQAVYTAALPENQKTAVAFWSQALRMKELPSLPVSGRGIIPLLVDEEWGKVGGKAVDDFRQTGINRKGKWEGPLPAENTAKYEDVSKMTITTSLAVPMIARAHPIMQRQQEAMPSGMESMVEDRGGKCHITMETGATDANLNIPRCLAVGLVDLVARGQYEHITLKAGNEVAEYIADLFLSALILHDRRLPRHEDGVITRPMDAVRPAVYCGLVEHFLDGATLVPKPPAPAEYRKEITPEEAQTLRTYLKWGDIKEGESPPESCRLPGIVVKSARDE